MGEVDRFDEVRTVVGHAVDPSGDGSDVERLHPDAVQDLVDLLGLDPARR
jgi:hypothetical protein